MLSLLLSFFSGPVSLSETPPMLYHSTNQGEAWYRFDEGLPEGAVPRNMVTDGDDLWLITDNDGLFVLLAGQDTWESRTGDLPKTVFATSLSVNGNFIALGTYQEGVWISRDGGQHWYRSVFNLQHNAVWSLTFKEGLIHAGTDRGFYRSYDGGIAWMGDEADYFQVSDLLEHDGKIYAARRDGIYVSKDNGDSWIQLFDKHPVYDLSLSKGVLYAAGGNTVLRSSDGGKNWQQFYQSSPADQSVDSVSEALWRGIKINTPDDRSARQIFETKRGWFLGIGAGC